MFRTRTNLYRGIPEWAPREGRYGIGTTCKRHSGSVSPLARADSPRNDVLLCPWPGSTNGSFPPNGSYSMAWTPEKESLDREPTYRLASCSRQVHRSTSTITL